MATLFGPVPSRRLGRSLGIDVIPPKTCTYDCVYCESGRTTHRSARRESFQSPESVLDELERYFQTYPGSADVLTFSSAGEPTLYKPLKELLQGIKERFPSLPLVVLTNGSLLWDPEVRQALLSADRVAPTLSTVSERTFRLLHRPHSAIRLRDVLDGLKVFRQQYCGQIHIEVMLVAGFNDNPEEWEGIRRFTDPLEPERIELNTVVRPPADSHIQAVSADTMRSALQYFPEDRSEIIGRFTACTTPEADFSLAARVVELVSRRPCTLSEMAMSLAVSPESLQLVLEQLEKEGTIARSRFEGCEYFCPARST